MQFNRLCDLSIFYWLRGIVPAIVNVEDGFPVGELTLPTVSITSLDIEGNPFELGGCELDNLFWRIDVFAKNKAQRDELAYLIYKELESNIAVHDYDVGFPPVVTPAQLGTLIVSRRKIRPVHVFEDLVEKLYWRMTITFVSYYEAI